MLKNPGKADLDKDGKLSGYEKKRGMAIEKSMSGKPMKAAMGAMLLGKAMKKDKDMKPMPLGMAAMLMKKKKMKEILGATKGKSVRGYGAARTSGMGLQDEAMKPGKLISKKMGGSMMNEKTREEIQKQKVKLGLGVFDEKGNFQAKKRKKMMGGGMMMKPMGYKKGSSIMARGCKLGRKKATKLS